MLSRRQGTDAFVWFRRQGIDAFVFFFRNRYRIVYQWRENDQQRYTFRVC